MQYLDLFNYGSFHWNNWEYLLALEDYMWKTGSNRWKKNEKKLATKKGDSMSIAGRVTLINSCLSNSFIYHMSMYLLPKIIVKNLNKQRRCFLWQGGWRKKNTTLLNGLTYAEERKREAWVLRTSQRWMLACFASDGGNWKWKMVSSRTLWGPNIYQMIWLVL